MTEMLQIQDLRPGMVLAEDTYSFEGRMVAPAGTVLSAFFISHLESCDLHEVWVDQSRTTWLH